MSESFDRFGQVLQFAGEHKLTDVLFKRATRPFYRRAGQLISRPQEQPFSEEDLAAVAERVMSVKQLARFNAGEEVTAVLPVVGVGRFRVHVFRQRGSIGLAVRVHPGRARLVRDIGLPPAALQLCGRSNGIVLLCSGAGDGRTSTAAALTEMLNGATPARRIVTIGAATEISVADKSAWTCQRDVDIDSTSWAAAVRGAIAQGCDVLMLDDVPDTETLMLAIDVAERGGLVLAAIAARDVAAALRKLLAAVPTEIAHGVRNRLVTVLAGAIEQRLVPTTDNLQQVAAFGVWLMEPRVYALIRDGHDAAALYDTMHSRAAGMCTADQHLAELYAAGTIAGDAALAAAIRPQALARR